MIIQIQNRNKNIQVINDKEFCNKGFSSLNTLIISDKEIKKYNINAQNVEVRIRWVKIFVNSLV